MAMDSVNPTYRGVIKEEEKSEAFQLVKKLRDTASGALALAEIVDRMKTVKPGRKLDAVTEAAVNAAEALAVLELHLHTVQLELCINETEKRNMANAAEVVKKSEAVIEKLKGAAVQIEKARLEVLEGEEAFSKAGDMNANRECRHIAGELLKLRERTEKLIQNERVLLKHLEADKAKQAACTHDWEPVGKVGPGQAKGVLYRCTKCFFEDHGDTGRNGCKHDWETDPESGGLIDVCTKCGEGRA